MRTFLIICTSTFLLSSCCNIKSCEVNSSNDSTSLITVNTISVATTETNAQADSTSKETLKQEPKQEQSVVYVYNFHLTNRCPSC